jgi:ABC-2 type transport system ATP-binding protein
MALPASLQEELVQEQTLADPAVIDWLGLSVSFGRRPILKNLRGDLRGKAIGLLGPNGAGKTTLIHTLLGFYEPSAGSARIFGYDIHDQAKQIKSLVGYMPERDSFIAKMSAVHFVRLMGELSGLPAEAAWSVPRSIVLCRLGEARYRKLETYSLGMKQLAKLAQAIVHGPKLLFLDEPTNGLDPPARLRMIKLIREIRDSGQAHIVLSSHLLLDVEECCDEILILREGQIAVYCNLEEERKSNRKFLMLETRGDLTKFVAALKSLGCEYAITGDHRLKIVLQGEVEVRDLYQLAAQERIQLRRLSYKRDSLEDIFSRRWRTAMAVYEQSYKRYIGPLTPEWSRFLIIPRHAYRGVFKSKIFTAFFVVCFVPLLSKQFSIYLHHNMNALCIMKVDMRS